jgi:hypothetical protein
VHTPAWQVSAPLQAFPSEHELPLARTEFWQLPLTQVSAVHGLRSLQSALTVQLWQPGIGVFWHPVTALQVSVVQALPSLQLGAVPGVQMPTWQVSRPLQTVPSLQDVPSATVVFWQPLTALQVSVVQTLPSLQLGGVPAVQTPV